MAVFKTKFVTPFGVARYPHISKPDSTGKYADNKYKTKLVFQLDSKEARALIDLIDEAAKEAHGPKGLKMHKPYAIDEDTNELVITVKSQYAPGIFDSKNKPVSRSVTVGGGSILRVMGQIVEFEKGITAQFNQVQVRELNSMGRSAFDEVDGYQFEDEASDGFDSSVEEDDESGLDI